MSLIFLNSSLLKNHYFLNYSCQKVTKLKELSYAIEEAIQGFIASEIINIA